MRVDSLEQPERDPNVHGENVQVLGDVAVQERSANGASSQNQNLGGMSVLGGQTKGSAVLVVDLVNVLVERAIVQGLVCKVMECIFKHEEKGDLGGDGLPAGERNLPGLHATCLCKRMEKPDLGKFDGKMRK